MSKDDSTSDPERGGEATPTDPDPVQIGDAPVVVDAPESEPEPEPRPEPEPEPEPGPKSEPLAVERPRRSWFGWFNFLLILALAGVAGYYWWLEQEVKQEYQDTIAELRGQLALKAGNDALAARLEPLQAQIGRLDRNLTQLGTEQKSLQAASEKLYELYGRDKNDWQLAEVEYLMRVAQHKLILQDDFAGAAVTLQAASDLIGLTGDPGLLPVRVRISEEIAELRTRKRADLVGMTLILAQLGREVKTLKPGFAPRSAAVESETQPPADADQDWQSQLGDFIDSLVEIRHESAEPTEIEASVADVGQTLADNLKLARWAVLERDAHRYRQLIEQSLRLFREFYDLDNAANHDFLSQLQDLQKRVLKPEKPDITGSLREMQRILGRREAGPEQPADSNESETQPQSESGNG